MIEASIVSRFSSIVIEIRSFRTCIDLYVMRLETQRQSKNRNKLLASLIRNRASIITQKPPHDCHPTNFNFFFFFNSSL